VLAKKLMESTYENHAGELETSIIMHLRPDLVREDMIGTLDGRPQRPEQPLGADVYTSADWYSMHPWHYAGDARPATPDKGRQIFESEVKNLAAIIKAVKADKATPKALAEYYSQFDIVKTYKAPAKNGKGKK
jgi:creatinine amidohydrolase